MVYKRGDVSVAGTFTVLTQDLQQFKQSWIIRERLTKAQWASLNSQSGTVDVTVYRDVTLTRRTRIFEGNVAHI